MKRQRTTISVGKEAVDFMVLEYTCIDNTVLSTIGKHCKESTWKICVGTEAAAPIDIKLHVDKNPGMNVQVSVTWDGQKVYPPGDKKAKAKLLEDFTYCVPYRGLVRGISQKNYFEMRPEHGGDDWYPATLLDQRGDGNCALVAVMPSGKFLPDGQPSMKDVHFPVVRPEFIREAQGKKPITVPRRSLLLRVPKEDPLHAVLCVDEGELITHFFSRPTPPPSKDASGACLVKPRILLKVTMDRETVTSDVGYALLGHFLKGEVRNGGDETHKWKKTWHLQIGPFAEHVIEVERRYRFSKVISLSVDGDVLCEALAEDLESRPGFWECSFRLEGERYLDWEVYETDVDGWTLDTKDLVREKQKCCYECIVVVPDPEKDVAGAMLTVDDVEFPELPLTKEPPSDEKVNCGPEALLSMFDLVVPHKINEMAARGLCRRAQMWTKQMQSKTQNGLLGACCTRPDVSQEATFRPSKQPQ